MKVSRPVKILPMLAAVFTLVVVSATPASATTGYWWVGNAAGGCLDYSSEFNFRVFRECNGNPNYQWLYFRQIPAFGPDAYMIQGRLGNGLICLEWKEYVASSATCNSSNARQIWIIRYANNQPYFDSFRVPGQCLTKSTFEDNFGGNVLVVDPCAGRTSQFWVWRDYRATRP